MACFLRVSKPNVLPRLCGWMGGFVVGGWIGGCGWSGLIGWVCCLVLRRIESRKNRRMELTISLEG